MVAVEQQRHESTKTSRGSRSPAERYPFSHSGTVALTVEEELFESRVASLSRVGDLRSRLQSTYSSGNRESGAPCRSGGYWERGAGSRIPLRFRSAYVRDVSAPPAEPSCIDDLEQTIFEHQDLLYQRDETNQRSKVIAARVLARDLFRILIATAISLMLSRWRSFSLACRSKLERTVLGMKWRARIAEMELDAKLQSKELILEAEARATALQRDVARACEWTTP